MRPIATLTVVSMLLLCGCVTFENESIPPTFTHSPEVLQLDETGSDVVGVDFGFELRSNESDSLTSVEILPGVKVVQVHANGPADFAGIQPNDVILELEGLETNDPEAIRSYARQIDQAQEVRMRLRRDTSVLEATLQVRPARVATPLRELYRIDLVATRASYLTKIVELPDGTSTVAAKVIAMDQDSPLNRANMQIGDLVLAVESLPVQSAQDLIDRVNQSHPRGATVTFQVLRDGQKLDRTVRLWAPNRYASVARLFPLFYFEQNRDEDQVTFKFPDILPLYMYERSSSRMVHRFLFGLRIEIER